MESSVNPVDVAIIGGGPSGLSAALWCSELGLTSVLIEQDESVGGQLRRIYNPIENYPGLSTSNGLEMLSLFEKSVAPRNFVRLTGIKATSIDVRSKEAHLEKEGKGRDLVRWKALILATGVRRRQLGIPGEIEFRGRGVLDSGAKDKASVSGKRVLIIGGSDAAFENAMILSEFAASVRIAYRRGEPSARREFVAASRSRENIEELPSTELTAITGESIAERVDLRDSAGAVRSEAVDAVLIRIGVEPNSHLVRGIVELGNTGYIKVNHNGETSVRGVYAVGDVAHEYSPTLSTAAGTAATAVKAIFHALKNPKAL